MDDDWDPFEAGVEGSIFQSMWQPVKGMPSISKMMDAAERAGEAHVASGNGPDSFDQKWDSELWDDQKVEEHCSVAGERPRRPRRPPPAAPQAPRAKPAPQPDEDADDTPDWLRNR